MTTAVWNVKDKRIWKFLDSQLICTPGANQFFFSTLNDLYQSYFRYENNDDDDEEEFFFDSDLNLEAHIDDNIVAAELLRPERLDTVEEVSEPPSESINSLPHDGVRWPEQQRYE